MRGGDVAFDSTGPLGTSRVLYRIVGEISDDRYFRELSFQRGKYIDPMLTVRLSRATTATVQVEYRTAWVDYENTGLLAPETPVASTVAQLPPIQTMYTAPGTWLSERGIATSLFVRHEFSGGGTLNFSARSVDSHWKVLLGVRNSHDRNLADSNCYSPKSPYASQTTITTLPEVGVIYQPSRHWSYYASYSTSYTPASPGTQGLVTAPLFKPTEGNGGEVGAKADFLHHRVDVTGALFLINETNVTAPYSGGVDALCPTGSCQVQVGAARSKGAELEFNAKPTDSLTLIAGYAYTDARVTQSTPTGQVVGDELADSPRNAFHFWTRYDVLSGPLRGFGAGLGFVYVGDRVANTGTSSLPGEFVLPAYELVDLGLYKQFANGLDVTLKINNLFDKTYYQDGTIASGMVSIDAGTPGDVELYLEYTF